MIDKLKALLYTLFHPELINMVIIRRYLDAQKCFIGELYMNGQMIGHSCDSLPYSAGVDNTISACNLELSRDFTEPMGAFTVRVGGMTPGETANVRSLMLKRRYCQFNWTIRHGFVEHVMEADCVR